MKWRRDERLIGYRWLLMVTDSDRRVTNGYRTVPPDCVGVGLVLFLAPQGTRPIGVGRSIRVCRGLWFVPADRITLARAWKLGCLIWPELL